ncbi:MAG: 23S rRNA (pseudouridine(1915)-N(3))-methyltransferase RlmH [Candidatus Puniceispirillaceae bacterium]
MLLHILAIGRAKKQAAESRLTSDYISRLPKGSLLYEAESRLPQGQARMRDESDKLLHLYHSKKPKSARLIALDPTGRNIASPDLAELISSWRDQGIGACYFAIGGADGHSDDLRAEADEILSFGAATWPHMLFRAMLAEQLYRAETIIANHPYHKS